MVARNLKNRSPLCISSFYSGIMDNSRELQTPRQKKHKIKTNGFRSKVQKLEKQIKRIKRSENRETNSEQTRFKGDRRICKKNFFNKHVIRKNGGGLGNFDELAAADR
jgi:hypothetical protein